MPTAVAVTMVTSPPNTLTRVACEGAQRKVQVVSQSSSAEKCMFKPQRSILSIGIIQLLMFYPIVLVNVVLVLGLAMADCTSCAQCFLIMSEKCLSIISSCVVVGE